MLNHNRDAFGAQSPQFEQTSFGVYVHWPYCRAKCPYCDFNSYVAQSSLDYKLWLKSYQSELAYYAQLCDQSHSGASLTSIFFGGGTPSLMPAQLVGDVISSIAQHWRLSDDCEITIEANPTSVEMAKMDDLAQLGVNRVSLGVQSFDDEVLKFLGREHSAAQAKRAYEGLKQRFLRTSMDFIYARPQQDWLSWSRELELALALEPEHLCLYQLTIEANTGFEQQVRQGLWQPLDDDDAALLFEKSRARLAQNKLEAYEVSNHALKGQESRHNLTYWRMQDYIGIGPGAHGRITHKGQKYATQQHRAPQIWLERCQSQGHATRTLNPLSADEQQLEALLMGLRLAEGVSFDRVKAVIDQARLDQLIASQDVILDQGVLKLGDAAFLRLDAILAWIVK